ncbi:MAG TPA: hypothetical protein VM889_12015 [Candidatus Thermoplasmatota archaeon]|nr:hypothetical protein [Candidatus Thermoplasmatota archaeon]
MLPPRSKGPVKIPVRPGAVHARATLELARLVLREAREPLAREGILLELATWGYVTTNAGLDSALAELDGDGSVAEATNGFVWIPEARGLILDAILRGDRP